MTISDVTGCAPNLQAVDFTGAYLLNTDWGRATVFGSDFTDAVLDNSSFRTTDAVQAIFTEATLHDVTFADSNLSGATFERAFFRDVTFTGSELAQTDFSGAIFDTQSVLPFFAPQPHEVGAYIRNARFTGAVGLTPPDRIYLCHFGGIDVPGGCAGIEALPDSERPRPVSLPDASPGGCW